MPDHDGAWFDEADAVRSIAFFACYLRFTKAEWSGSPFWLEPWDITKILCVIGCPDSDRSRAALEELLRPGQEKVAEHEGGSLSTDIENPEG